MLDNVFKVAVLCILVAILAVVWGTRNNGRYVMLSSDYTLLDTRTGTLYDMTQDALRNFEGAISMEEHPQTGQISLHYAWARKGHQ